MVDRLPEDRKKVGQIPVDISSANRDIQRAKTQGNFMQIYWVKDLKFVKLMYDANSLTGMEAFNKD